MQLKQRIKKIERQVNFAADSEFCGCERDVREPGDPPFPEFCETCGKPLNVIVIQPCSEN